MSDSFNHNEAATQRIISFVNCSQDFIETFVRNCSSCISPTDLLFVYFFPWKTNKKKDLPPINQSICRVCEIERISDFLTLFCDNYNHAMMEKTAAPATLSSPGEVSPPRTEMDIAEHSVGF